MQTSRTPRNTYKRTLFKFHSGSMQTEAEELERQKQKAV